MTQTSKLPKDDKPIRLDPDLAKALEDLLKPYKGEKLERAQQAVLHVRASGVTGQWADLIAHYDAAIKEAVGKA